MYPFDDPDVEAVFNHYPAQVHAKMIQLRQLVFETASASKEKLSVQETLKWGEPSYLSKNGSTIRMDWKSSRPDQFALYFHCKTSLIETFKALYSELKFESNRAILFDIKDEIPIEAVKHCIYLSLTYHKRKHLPALGV